MLDAAIDVAPQEKRTAAKDYIFLMLFQQRQGAICFAAVAAGAVYGMTLPLLLRDPLHFVYGVIAVLMMLANANHAGIPFLGNHPKVSRHGKHVGIAFAPFWALVAALNWSAFANAWRMRFPRRCRQIVEFLNEQMRSSEVIAVEVTRHECEGMSTLVSRVICQTATARQTKQAGPRR